MHNKLKYLLLTLIVVLLLTDLIPAKDKPSEISTNYFPIESNVAMVYKSSFGKAITQYFQDGIFAVSSSEGDDFTYRQIMIIKDDGVYVKETYQYFNIFLFINKEATVTYGEPLLRFPLPLAPGMAWNWEGDEYSDGDTSIVKVSGQVLDTEIITTAAGSFETIKLQTIIEGESGSKNNVTEWYAEDIGLIKAEIVIEGGGMMGFLRDILGYGTIEFELEEIRKQ